MSNQDLQLECGPGWKFLTDIVIAEATRRGIVLTQIKEKWGCLRIYYDMPPQGPPDPIFDNLIDALEFVSPYACGLCGKPRLKVPPQNVGSLCPECLAKARS